jgi:hypothetical protein
MKTERLMQSGILNSGEPRHYASWDPPTVPRLNASAPAAGVNAVLSRRQRARGAAPEARRIFLGAFLDRIRKGRCA